MAQPLAGFDGAALYVDAVILVAFLDTTSPWHAASQHLFYRAIEPAHPIRLVTATLAIDEAVFALLQELLRRPPYNVARSRSQYLGAHPEVVQQMMASVDYGVQRVLRIVALEPVLPADIDAMRREMIDTGALPRDAIHLAVMRRLGITAIASDDDDFERSSGITLFKP